MVHNAMHCDVFRHPVVERLARYMSYVFFTITTAGIIIMSINTIVSIVAVV